MSHFIVHVLHPSKPDRNIRHEFESPNDYTAAYTSAEVVRLAYEEQKVTEAMVFKLVVLWRDFDKPPKAWSISLPGGEMEPCEVPCGYCGGSGGVDSGGSTPQGAPIDIPCPSCAPEPKPAVVSTDWVKCPICDEPDMRKETTKDGDVLIHCVNHACRSNGGEHDNCEHAIQLRAWQEAFGTSQLTHALAEKDQHTKALINFQNDVWASLNTYAHKLGWGLSGMQPECWTCLDAAVEELVKARNIISEVRKAIHMPEESSDDNVPQAARTLMAMYEASQPPPRG